MNRTSKHHAYALGNPVSYSDPSGLIVPLIVAGRCVIGFGSGYLAVDGAKVAMQDFQAMQKARESQKESSNCPNKTAGSTNPPLVKAVGVVQDASSAFANQGAAAQWRLATMGTASVTIGLLRCSVVGAGLAAAFGNGGATRTLDGSMNDAAEWLEGH